MRRHLFSLLTDTVLVVIATLVALAIRDNFEIKPSRVYQLLPYLGWTVLAALVVFPLMGLTRSIWRFSSMSDYTRVLPAVVFTVLSAVALGFQFNRLDFVSRALPVLQGILMVCFLIGGRVAFRFYHRQRRSRPKLLEAIQTPHADIVLVVGVNRITELYLASVEEYAIDRIKVVGLLGQSDRQIGRLMQSTPVLGRPEDAAVILNELSLRGIAISRIVVTMAFDRLSLEARKTLLDIERNTNIKLDLFGERLLIDERQSLSAAREDESDASVRDVAAFVVDEDARAKLSNQRYWMVKRAFDFGLACALIIVCVPLFLIVALVVLIDVGWPVIFWQQRPGLGGYNFKLYKFRTMATAYDDDGARLQDTQRLSATGKFLRRTRLDELPQLVHVLLGHMSFVGPRPLLPIDQSPAHAVRLMVRPGMTGWAQIKGGRDISPADKAALDVWYLKNACLRLDISIMLQTIPMVLSGETVDHHAIRAAWQELVDTGVCAAAQLPVEYRPGHAAAKRAI
jgi:lipopolysaccharide/colanic/teichoic acid biosynthesis glycosyltransferase